MCEPYEMYTNWPLPIRAFQDQSKQTMTMKYSSGHNKVKNPSWQEEDQLAISDKRSREVELGATDLKSGTLTTRPRCSS